MTGGESKLKQTNQNCQPKNLYPVKLSYKKKGSKEKREKQKERRKKGMRVIMKGFLSRTYVSVTLFIAVS